MAYKIQYTSGDARRYPLERKRKKIKWGRGVMFALLLSAALWLSQKGIPDFLIPGDPQVTRAAAADMVTQMKDGASLEQAVTAFCEQILNGAQQ